MLSKGNTAFLQPLDIKVLRQKRGREAVSLNEK